MGSGIIGPPRYCMGMPLCPLGREGCSGPSQCLRTRGLRDAMYVLSGGKPREMQVLICIRIGTRSLWYKIRKAFEFPSHWSRFEDPGSEAVARPTRSRCGRHSGSGRESSRFCSEGKSLEVAKGERASDCLIFCLLPAFGPRERPAPNWHRLRDGEPRW